MDFRKLYMFRLKCLLGRGRLIDSLSFYTSLSCIAMKAGAFKHMLSSEPLLVSGWQVCERNRSSSGCTVNLVHQDCGGICP
jgi:hypothetical protein